MGLFHFDRRPLLLIGAGACCGVCITTGESWIYAVLLFAALAGIGKFYGTSNRLLAIFAAACLFFALWGFTAASINDSSYSRFEDRECHITGRITSVDAYKERYTLVTVKPDGIWNKKIKVYLFDNRLDFIQGDGISLTGKLIKPEAATNPGGYDSRKVLYGDGITAIVFCSEGDAKYLYGASFGHVFGLLRKSILETCRNFLGETNGNLVAAMLIGDKTRLDPVTKEQFRDSGLSHTMAVSGSHVAYILVPLYFLFSKLGISKRKYYPWLIVILVFFAVLAGMQPSVMRAGLTALIMLAGGLLERNPEPLNSLAASALMLLLLNPFSLYDAGFILSYASVLSILLFYKPISKILGKNPVADIVAMSVAVQLGLLPITAGLFYNIQVFSVFANILVFPVRAILAVMGWLMYLLSCIYSPLGKVLAFPVGIFADIISSSAELFSNSAWSVVNVPYIHPMVVVIYYVSLWLVLKKRTNRLAYASAGAIIICIYFLFFAVPADTWIFFDSGQADCFLIKTSSGRDILIDTGEYALSNSIAHYAGDYIDSIFLSHAHDDHIGGLAAILDRFRVGVVYIPGCNGSEMQDVIRLCFEKGIPCTKLIAGDNLSADGCLLEILNPADYEYMSLNDTSMVIKLTCRDKSLLLCGDAEIPAELDMIARNCDLSADVLKVPHHGAVNAAEPGFIEAVGADIAVISCGPNDYKHPAYETLDRLDGCMIYRSDLHGAVIISIKKQDFRVKTENK